MVTRSWKFHFRWFYNFFLNINVISFYFHFLERVFSYPLCYLKRSLFKARKSWSFKKQPISSFFRNNIYCFPGQGNVGHYTKKVTEKGVGLFIKYLLRLVLSGVLLLRRHLLLLYEQSYNYLRSIIITYLWFLPILILNIIYDTWPNNNTSMVSE